MNFNPETTDKPHGFTSKGIGLKPSFNLYCQKEEISNSTCSINSTLIFKLSYPGDYNYFSAFASDGSGKAIWYFPGKKGTTSIDISGIKQSEILEKGILIGSEHSPGSYDIYGVFSKTILSKNDIKSIIENKYENQEDLSFIIKRKISVEDE